MITPGHEWRVRCYFGGHSPAVATPPPTPTQTGAAKLLGDKNPNANKSGLSSTILTQPQNQLAQDQSLMRKKTLLGE